MKYNKSFLDTYRKYISKGWYENVISSITLERWCENFNCDTKKKKFDPKICAHFLLNSLIFYQNRQLEAIIINIQNRIKSELNQKYEQVQGRRLSEEELIKIWTDYKKDCYIISAAFPEDTAGSAHHATRLWRNISGIETGSINNLMKAIEEKRKKHIIFVDDFIGTGSRVDEFLSSDMFPKENTYGFKCVQEVIDKHNNVDYNIAVFAIHESGLTKLSSKYPSINFYYGDLYSEDYNILNTKCVLFDVFGEYQSDIQTYISNKKKEIGYENEYELNLPITFSHGCPNNSLSLYYKEAGNWIKLISESHPQESS